MNPTGYDDIVWDPPETWADLGFSGPSLRGGMGIMLIVCALAGIMLVAPVMLKKARRRRKGYRRVRASAGPPAPDYEQRVVA